MLANPGSRAQPMVLLTAFVVLVFVYSLLSRRLERTVVTAPMLFTAAGAAFPSCPSWRPNSSSTATSCS